MEKITVVEWLPFGQQSLFVIPTEGKTVCQLHVENENPEESHFIDLDSQEVQKLTQVLQGVLEGKEVSHG